MKKSFLICFFGMDGSGKSTLSHFLYEELQKRKINTFRIWWLERENSFLRKSFREMYKIFSPNYKLNPSGSFSKEPHVFGFKFVFRLIFPRIILIDYLIFGFFHAWIPMHFREKKLLIFDRYYPDIISALKEEFGISEDYSILIKIFKIIIPDPDLVFIIKVRPDIAYIRKREEIFSIENAKNIWQRQKNMYDDFIYKFNKSKILKIDNSGDISKTKMILLSEILNTLHD
jgi:thymidylate kinase